MKILLVMLVMLTLLTTVALVDAKPVQQPCVSPAWVSTSPTQVWMPALCSTVTIQAYVAVDNMKPKAISVTVLGYWHDLVYAQSLYNTSEVWLLDESQFK